MAYYSGHYLFPNGGSTTNLTTIMPQSYEMTKCDTQFALTLKGAMAGRSEKSHCET